MIKHSNSECSDNGGRDVPFSDASTYIRNKFQRQECRVFLNELYKNRFSVSLIYWLLSRWLTCQEKKKVDYEKLDYENVETIYVKERTLVTSYLSQHILPCIIFEITGLCLMIRNNIRNYYHGCS